MKIDSLAVLPPMEDVASEPNAAGRAAHRT